MHDEVIQSKEGFAKTLQAIYALPESPVDTIKKIEKKYGLPRGSIFKKNKEAHVVFARKEAIKVFHDAGFSSTQIGKLFNRDHSSILHSLKK